MLAFGSVWLQLVEKRTGKNKRVSEDFQEMDSDVDRRIDRME